MLNNSLLEWQPTEDDPLWKEEDIQKESEDGVSVIYNC